MEIADKINALLRQAEGTPFGEEADAFIAKAHELMERHSITQAMLSSSKPSESAKIIKATITVVAPYTEAKAALAFAVLRANNCEGVYWGSAAKRIIQFVGYSHDTDATIRMYNSLEMQAVAGIPAALKHKPSWEHGKTFTNSFLNAYANRIGHRLRDMNKVIETEMDAEYGGTLLPALVSKKANVEQARDTYWPNTTTKTVQSGWSQAGAEQGRSAANRASVGNNSVGGSGRKALS